MSAFMIRDATSDWKVGDLAMCVDRAGPTEGGWRNALDGEIFPGPSAGTVHRVATVYPGRGPIETAITFDAWPDHLYPARCFRRMTPDLPTAADRAAAAAKRAAPPPAGNPSPPSPGRKPHRRLADIIHDALKGLR